MKSQYQKVLPYITKDGSEIRELMHPDQHPVTNQSLAEATVPAGTVTQHHRHLLSEEIYHITSGRGIMFLGSESFEVKPGDSVVIPPGTPHAIENNGDEPLTILCCCSPPYSHEDTELIDS